MSTMHEPVSSVRLPSVQVPMQDLNTVPPGFNPFRRVSLSDPFLHATTSNSSVDYPNSSLRQSISASHASGKGTYSRPGSPTDTTTATATSQSHLASIQAHHAPYPFQAGYHPTSSQSNSLHPPTLLPPPTAPHVTSPVGPNSNYRFGGPSQSNSEAPSYYDYSMRRHSLTNNQPPHAADHSSANPSLKRKVSNAGENVIHEDSLYTYSMPPPSSHTHPLPTNGGMPYSKRRGSSLTYDKMNSLSLAEQNRRDSALSSQGGNLSPWEDDRRGSGGSWTSVSSQPQTYSQYSVPPPHQPQQVALYEQNKLIPQSVQQENSFARRPSIGIDQLVQGTNYGQPHAHPTLQPTQLLHPNNSNFVPGPPPQSRINSNLWNRSEQQTHENPSQRPPGAIRTTSNSSLDPSMAYGPGGMLKDSPYSRSPELRVTHKLAERKRRKEMAQLFDDLRDALPVDKAVKSSKWEILSKAVDFIDALKRDNQDLLRDNSALRQHFGLPQAPPAAVPNNSAWTAQSNVGQASVPIMYETNGGNSANPSSMEQNNPLARTGSPLNQSHVMQPNQHPDGIHNRFDAGESQQVKEEA